MERLEKLIKLVYKKWKEGLSKTEGAHPDEEAIACFLENRLSQEENERIRAHLLRCDYCMEAFSLNFAGKASGVKEVPEELLDRVKGMLAPARSVSLLEIALRLKEKAWEIINSNGDCLVGRELVPARVLRSRSIGDFKDEVIILKDFQDIRVEVRIENKGKEAFNLIITIKQKRTQEAIKDLRITLLKGDLELESRLTDTGAVIFEHVLIGKYTIEISTLEDKVAAVILDIRT